MKNSLLDIVLTQAQHALEELRKDKVNDADRERQLDDLFGAAQLVDDDNLEDEVRSIGAVIIAHREEGVAALEQFVESLQIQLRHDDNEVVAESADNHGPAASESRTQTIGDSSPTGVHRSSRRRNSSFDTGEHLTLLNIFREKRERGSSALPQSSLPVLVASQGTISSMS